MTLDEILDHWDSDAKIDTTKIEESIRNIPLLHGKYLRFLSIENRELRKLEKSKNRILHTITTYYFGYSTQEELKILDRPQYAGPKLLRQDITLNVNADKLVLSINEKYDEQKEKIDAIVSIMNEIAKRNFHLRAVIDHRKFEAAIV